MPSGIIVHASDTYPDMNIGAAEITRWHVDENGWSDIGYHWVIKRDGTVEAGRDENTPGAHARGHNDDIGICLVGGKGTDNKPDANFTMAQYSSLVLLIDEIKKRHKITQIIGHRDVSSKACPCFDINALLKHF